MKDHEFTFDGFKVTLTRSEQDGTMLVYVDTPQEADIDPDGAPCCRIYLNDDPEPLYENPAWVPWVPEAR